VIPRVARWYDERPVSGDAVLAAVLLLAFVLPSDLAAPTDPVADLAFSIALLACVPFRRRLRHGHRAGHLSGEGSPLAVTASRRPARVRGR
jgi:hypothetical protein